MEKELQIVYFTDDISKKNFELKIFNYENKIYFATSNVIKALQYKKTCQLDNAKKGISKELKFDEHIHHFYIGKQKRVFVDELGLELFLQFCSRTHSIPTKRLSEFLVKEKLWKGFSKDIIMPLPTKESSTIGAIQQATFKFESQTCFLIKGQKDRKLDLFYPKQKLGIECDENNHSNYCELDEAKRNKLIEENGIEIYRFNPDSPSFNIFIVIGEIFERLYKK